VAEIGGGIRDDSLPPAARAAGVEHDRVSMVVWRTPSPSSTATCTTISSIRPASRHYGMAGERRPVELERTELDESGQLTSLRYRVRR